MSFEMFYLYILPSVLDWWANSCIIHGCTVACKGPWENDCHWSWCDRSRTGKGTHFASSVLPPLCACMWCVCVCVCVLLALLFLVQTVSQSMEQIQWNVWQSDPVHFTGAWCTFYTCCGKWCILWFSGVLVACPFLALCCTRFHEVSSLCFCSAKSDTGIIETGWWCS